MIELGNISIYILAGGKSQRMGQEKGLVNYKGKSMIQYIIDIAKRLNPEVIKIVSSNDDYSKFGFELIQDKLTDCGPAGGIHAALTNSNTELNLILPCDTPELRLEFLMELLSRHQSGVVTIPKAGGQLHHIIGIYEKKHLQSIQECIQLDDLKMSIVTRKIGLNIVDFDAVYGLEYGSKLTVNINDKQVLDELSSSD